MPPHVLEAQMAELEARANARVGEAEARAGEAERALEEAEAQIAKLLDRHDSNVVAVRQLESHDA